jgi:hypothetical protein
MPQEVQRIFNKNSVIKQLSVWSFALSVCLTPAWAKKIVHVDVSDSNPLNLIVGDIELATGVPISYEECQVLYSDDLVDVTKQHPSAQFLQGHPERKYLIPKSIHVKADIDVPEGQSKLSTATSMLQDLMNTPALKDARYHFKIVQTGTQLSLVPVEHRDQSGNWTATTDPLDTVISYGSSSDANFWQTMTHILDAVKNTARIKIGLGTVPNNVVARLRTSIQVENQPARAVIQMALDKAKDIAFPDNPTPKMSWRLLYDPALGWYVLHLRLAAKEVPAPFGGTMVAPITSHE